MHQRQERRNSSTVTSAVSVNDVTVIWHYKRTDRRGQSTGGQWTVPVITHGQCARCHVLLIGLGQRGNCLDRHCPDVLPSAYLLNCPAAALTPDRTTLVHHVFRNENKMLRVDNSQRQA